MKKLWMALFCLMLFGCKADSLVNLAGTTSTIEVQTKDGNEVVEFVRGSEFYLDKVNDEKAVIYEKVDGKKIKYEVSPSQITEDYNTVVQNREVTVTLNHNLRQDRDEDISDTYVTKGETLQIVSCNMDRDFNSDGSVDGYMVSKDGKTYYLDAFYTQKETLDKSKISHSDLFDSSYWYGEGYSQKTYIDDITYLDVDRQEFEGKPFNGNAKAVHVGLNVAIDQKDYLIQLCKETGLDSLVVEIKSDSGQLMFKSDTAKALYGEDYGVLTKEEFKDLCAEYKENDIYLIGRVVAFKDEKYAHAYPENSIQNGNGSLLIHNGEPWPSPYSRDVWRYLVGFSKEAVELGIDEIQYDFCRFPDGMHDESIDYQNEYGESKAQAITHFLYYAREELRKVKGYLSVDVFGWVMISGDDQDIGQFIPAIANVVDAISPMPYPDHFQSPIFGISIPAQNPGELLKQFTKESMKVLNQIPNAATYRTWIQGYACLSWVCKGTPENPSRSYGPSDMIAQIEGIRSEGQDGYIVWSGEGSQGMFDFRKAGFID